MVLTALAAMIWAPLWLIISGSLMGAEETAQNLAPVLGKGEGSALWPLLPMYPTLQPLAELLLDSPEFFVMFWNSCLQVFPVVAGQILIGAPAAWAFARYKFRGKKALFTLYIVLMLMPFQVTMVSSYLVLDGLGLMDTVWSVILPGAVSTFPVFLMTRFFAAIPQSFIEAAELDGAGRFQVFWRVGIPLGAPGILSAVVLGFLEYWNALEAPLTFLKDKTLWPLSLYLPAVTTENAGSSLAASVVMLIPALLIFLFGQRYLEEGIAASGLKE
ncbi:MAG: carbohydrate ABC transporter permease [Clostridia bacterium]|nr:carbohydrate ABC transporter permease [Clostridia bacterium]